MTPQYKLAALRKSYGNRLALDIDELALLPGRLYILSGPNGSGKSTLLNILAFLMKPDGGEVAFAGNPVTWKNEELFLLRRRVTLLHQAPYLFGGSVFGNLAFGLKAREIKREKLRQAVSEALRLVGLAGFEQRNIKQLSGGEAQRVALARALVLNPEVLLIDEPLASVDKASTGVLETVIASLPARGTTVVMSTHDQFAGQRLNGKLIRLLEGRLETTTSAPGEARQPAAPSEGDGKAEGATWSVSKMHVN